MRSLRSLRGILGYGLYLGPYNLVWVMYSCNSVYDVNVKFGEATNSQCGIYICVVVYIYRFGVMWIDYV